MRRKILRKRWRAKDSHLGFQVAPMIDVVFVILLFFMVAAGNARRETALKTELPAEYQDDKRAAVELPDEIEITIDEEGRIHLNEEVMDEAGSKGLPLLTQELRALKEAAGNDLNKIAILLKPDERVKYQRIVDVLDVLATEKINKVQFQAAPIE
jgi:biopolymer transport protein ExbD